MLRYLFRKFYPGVFDFEPKYHNQIAVNLQLEIDIRNLKDQLHQSKQKLANVVSALDNLSTREHCIKLKTITSKKGKPFLLVIEETFGGMHDNDINVFVYELHEVDPSKWVGQLYTHKFNTTGSLKIVNFQIKSEYENEGVGLSMMKELFHFVNYRNLTSHLAKVQLFFNNPYYISLIYGELVPNDYGHIDKLKHLYEKLGFTVVIDNEKGHGTITKKTDMPK